MTILGAVCRPVVPPERLRDIAVTAEDAGLEELWLWEDCFWGGAFTAASAVLAWTGRLRVGIGVFPVPLRNVALTAMEISMLYRLFPDRAVIGVGHGVQDWMKQVGAGAESPMTLLREYLSALRALLRGDRVSTDGRYVRLDDVALGWPPAAALPVLSAATGPRTLRLAGEAADGTIIDSETTIDQLRKARQLIDEGRAAAGRTDPHRIVVYLRAATGPGAAERMAATLAAVASPLDRPNSETAVVGDAAMVAAAVRRWADAGAGTVVLVPTADDPDPAAFVRFVGEQVRPLVP